MTPEQRLARLENTVFGRVVKTDRYIFDKPFQLLDGRNIQLGQTTGTKIGTANTQKLGFYGATPIARHIAIAAPSGGTTVDAQGRTATSSILSLLATIGLTQ